MHTKSYTLLVCIFLYNENHTSLVRWGDETADFDSWVVCECFGSITNHFPKVKYWPGFVSKNLPTIIYGLYEEKALTIVCFFAMIMLGRFGGI